MFSSKPVTRSRRLSYSHGPSRSRRYSGMTEDSRNGSSATSSTENRIEPTVIRNGVTQKHPLLLLLVIFILYIGLLCGVYFFFPSLLQEERKHFKIPWDMSEAKALAEVLDRYKGDHYWTVLIGFALTYIFLQSFAIPGSIFLSIMSGFLFPFWTALMLICSCCAMGASACYLMSWLVARDFVRVRFSKEIGKWSRKVEDHDQDLLNFIIFLRITPILPNWVINIVAPHIGVPLKTFWIATFVGVAPPSALAVQAGTTLNAMTSPTDHISWSSMLLLGVLAMASLIPVMWRNATT